MQTMSTVILAGTLNMALNTDGVAIYIYVENAGRQSSGFLYPCLALEAKQRQLSSAALRVPRYPGLLLRVPVDSC